MSDLQNEADADAMRARAGCDAAHPAADAAKALAYG